MSSDKNNNFKESFTSLFIFMDKYDRGHYIRYTCYLNVVSSGLSRQMWLQNKSSGPGKIGLNTFSESLLTKPVSEFLVSIWWCPSIFISDWGIWLQPLKDISNSVLILCVFVLSIVITLSSAKCNMGPFLVIQNRAKYVSNICNKWRFLKKIS